MTGHGALIVESVSWFAFCYPLLLAHLWVSGALMYYFRYERAGRTGAPARPRALAIHPHVSVVVPCHNEGRDIEDTVAYLLASRYPAFDIVLVNDGSTDDTSRIIDALAARHPKVRVIHLTRNQGKAVALTTASLMTPAPFLACIDADALLDPDALDWVMPHFLNSRVAAVTGNPRVRNRSTLLSRLQLGEYTSIIGLIKRAQRIYGRIFSVSGVVACFRKSALHDVGYWSADMLTEDIDITWKLQIRRWDVRFEPRARCWILAPETLRGLWNQRLRWATGGVQVLLKNWRVVGTWKTRRMWPLFFESALSVAWAYLVLGIATLWLLGLFVDLPPDFRVPAFLSAGYGAVAGTVCLVQVALSLALDSRYDVGLLKGFFWMIWYPIAYWMLIMATTIVGVPQALLRGRKERARWTSPDRGILP